MGYFLKKYLWIDNDSVAYYVDFVPVEYSRRNQMENKLLFLSNYSVPRVIASVKACYDIRLFRKKVYNLALAFVSELRSNDCDVSGHGFGQCYWVYKYYSAKSNPNCLIAYSGLTNILCDFIFVCEII